MSYEDRDWGRYVRSLSLFGPSPARTPQKLQRSRREDFSMEWTEIEGRLPEDLFEELTQVLGYELRRVTDSPEAWSTEEEASFEEEINALWRDYEKDQTEIERG